MHIEFLASVGECKCLTHREERERESVCNNKLKRNRGKLIGVKVIKRFCHRFEF